jgi:hypothetical protein
MAATAKDYPSNSQSLVPITTHQSAFSSGQRVFDPHVIGARARPRTVNLGLRSTIATSGGTLKFESSHDASEDRWQLRLRDRRPTGFDSTLGRSAPKVRSRSQGRRGPGAAGPTNAAALRSAFGRRPGSRLAFERGSAQGASEIWIMNADGTGKSRITSPGSVSRNPSW